MNENGSKGTGDVETNRIDTSGGRAGGVEANGANWSGQETSFEGISRPDIAEIAGHWGSPCDKVAVAVSHAGREENAVSILLAAKFQEPERVAAVLRAGGNLTSHSYIQQLEEDEKTLIELGIPFHRVHVIDHVQANKAGEAIRAADYIETVDSPKLAARLDRLQGERISAGKLRKGGSPLGPFNVTIQINSTGSESRHGVDPSGVVDLAGAVADLPNLRLVGLMLIDANTDDVAAVTAFHARVHELRGAVQTVGVISYTELSMSMTGDMEIAIVEGSTEVRIGMAVFGPHLIMKQNRSR